MLGEKENKLQGILEVDTIDDIDKLYVSRKEEERRLTNIKNCMDAPIQRLAHYIKRIKINNSIGNRSANRKRKTIKTRKKKWKEKQVYGYIKQQPGEIARKKTWAGLRKRNLN